MKRAIVAIAITIAVSVSANGDTWWKHVQFLADDSMRGRDTGSPEHKRAAEYVAAEFRKSGLEPAGAGGFIQPVAFKTRRIDEAHSSLAIIRDGRTMALTLGEHANFSLRADPAPAVDAPLVFVGHGLNVPEQNINDLDGLNLKGALWSRPKDEAGVAFVVNGLSNAHRDYLAAGGLGFIIGDGRLNYAHEEIVEVYYNWVPKEWLTLTADFQGVDNPGYNHDRGPVAIFGIRMHLAF